MSKQCDIVQDILPLYVDGACSEASAEMVKEHLTTCSGCSAIYQKLLSHTNEDVLHEESEGVIMRHEAKEKHRNRKNITVAVLVSLVLCIAAIFTVVCLLPINIDFEPATINLTFNIDDIESVDMYRYEGMPASAEKKVVTDREAVQRLYEMLERVSVRKKSIKGDPSETRVTSFRFNLSDGSNYEIVYTEYGVKRGTLSSEHGGFEFFTKANIGWYWEQLDAELEAAPANEGELPR